MSDASLPSPASRSRADFAARDRVGATPDRNRAAEEDARLLQSQRRAAAARLAASLTMAELEPNAVDAGPPVDEDAVFELRASAIGDIDEAGGRIVVTLDRIVLRDADGWERGAVVIEDLERVDVKRRFGSTSIHVKGSTGAIKLKGVRQTRTVGLRAAISELRFPDDPEGSTTADELRRLDERARIGLLTADELADRRADVLRRSQ